MKTTVEAKDCLNQGVTDCTAGGQISIFDIDLKLILILQWGEIELEHVQTWKSNLFRKQRLMLKIRVT